MYIKKAFGISLLTLIISGFSFRDADQKAVEPETLADFLKPVKQQKGGPTGSGILYVTDAIPEISYPEIEGKYYQTLVPDTLDVAERARLAVHGLTSCTDPASDY